MSSSSLFSYEAGAAAALLAPLGVVAHLYVTAPAARLALAYSCGAAAAAFLATFLLVPAVAPAFARKGLKGRDLGRRGTAREAVEVPSALGLVAAVVFLAVIIVSMLWPARSAADLRDYNAALLSVCFMVLLGFADDVLDLPWRYKLLLPMVASLPLLLNYHAGGGGTTVVTPQPLRFLLAAADGSGLTPLGTLAEWTGLVGIDAAHGARTVDLGLLYLLYMGLLAIFATNAINIYAGINGLEAGQSFVIGVAVLTANVLELAWGAEGEHERHHIFSATLALPFIAATAGLLAHNVHPARVFVGDTFCYFAGMSFAVMAILGHFSKTLLLLLLPQLVNFLYSLPQLFKVYPCPRHRLPEYDAFADVMRPSGFTLEAEARAAVAVSASSTSASAGSSQAVGPGARAAVAVSASSTSASAGSLQAVGAGGAAAAPASRAMRRGSFGGSSAAASAPQQRRGAVAAVAAGAELATPQPRRFDNMTLINLMLRVCGPMHERTATNVLLLLQVLSCAFGLALRSYLQVLFADDGGLATR